MSRRHRIFVGILLVYVLRIAFLLHRIVLDLVTRTTKHEFGSSDRVDIALAKGTVANDREFILDYRLAGEAIESGLLLHQGPDENFFLAMSEPPKNVVATAIVPREYMLVIDIPGSMRGYPLDTAKTLLTKRSSCASLRSSRAASRASRPRARPW